MLICLDCERTFEESELSEWTEAHGEHFTGCPYCLSFSIREAEKCGLCGEYVSRNPYDECPHCGSGSERENAL